jgi:hypothetical protein
MEEISEFERKDQERAALFAEATRIVQAAEAQSGSVTAEEDARVLELMARIRILDEQIGHLRRHREPDQQQKRGDNQ